MKQISVDELKVGDVIARPVLFKGSILLDIGTVLTEEYIKSLKKREIRYVYIEESDEGDSTDEIDELVDLSSDTLIDEYINQIKNFDFSKEKPENFYNLIDELGNLKNAKAIPVLDSILRNLPKELDEKKLKLHIFKALEKMPKDSEAGNIFLVQLTLNNPPDIKLEALEGIAKFPKDDYIYPLLSYTKHLNATLLSKLSDTLLNFDAQKIEQNAMVLLSEVDDNQKRIIIKVLENVLSEEKISELSKKYLGINVEQKAHNIREKVKITPKAEEVFSSEPVTKIDADSIKDLTEFNEAEITFASDDEIVKPTIQKVELFTEQDKKNIKAAFQKIYNANLIDTQVVMHDFRKGLRIQEKKLEELVSKLIIQVNESIENVFSLVTNNTINNYVLSHSLNTAYLSLLLGKLAGFDDSKMMILGLSALLHDIGMVKLKELVWNEPKQLNEDEKFIIKKHTILGIDGITSSTRLPKDVAYVAYQHHERLDGSGYPKGRKKILISEYSQIVGLCDVFCAMISSRVYRKAHPLHQVINYFMYQEPEKFNQDFFKLLLAYIQQYVDADIITKAQNAEIKSETQVPKIMVIDDQQDITSLIKSILESNNFRVIAFNNPKIALESYRHEKPDLVIVDLMMPEMDGFEVCNYIRKLPTGKEQPIIVLTVKKDKTSVIKAMQYKVSAYIAKPFQQNDFLKRVRNALQGGKA